MSNATRLIRQKAKEEYKKIVKGMPKKQRPTFSQVFKQIRQGHRGATRVLPSGEVVAPKADDVDMSELDDLFIDAEEGTNEVEDSK